MRLLLGSEPGAEALPRGSQATQGWPKPKFQCERSIHIWSSEKKEITAGMHLEKYTSNQKRSELHFRENVWTVFGLPLKNRFCRKNLFFEGGGYKKPIFSTENLFSKMTFVGKTYFLKVVSTKNPFFLQFRNLLQRTQKLVKKYISESGPNFEYKKNTPWTKSISQRRSHMYFWRAERVEFAWACSGCEHVNMARKPSEHIRLKLCKH